MLNQDNMSIETYISKCCILNWQARVGPTRLWEILIAAINQKVREEVRRKQGWVVPPDTEAAFNMVQNVGQMLEDNAAFDKMIDKGEGTTKPKATEPKARSGTRKKGNGGVKKRTQKKKKADSSSSTTEDLDGITQSVIDKRKTESQCLKCG